MNRIPIARLTRGEAVIVVYFDDYFDDYCEDLPNLPPYPPPEYTAVGDKFLKREFEDFVDFDGLYLRLPNEYYPYPWSKASSESYRFAKSTGCKHEDIFPQTLQDEVDKAYNPNTLY